MLQIHQEKLEKIWSKVLFLILLGVSTAFAGSSLTTGLTSSVLAETVSVTTFAVSKSVFAATTSSLTSMAGISNTKFFCH